MRDGHKSLFVNKLWGKKFWSSGYFHRTVGAVNATTVKKYVAESQGKHWQDKLQVNQKTLLSYS